MGDFGQAIAHRLPLRPGDSPGSPDGQALGRQPAREVFGMLRKRL
jgi:hypothetical protein